jgi:hypothetical protein
VNPSVTVLIAVHDGGDLLLDAVQSVLAQTHRDFELLLIDDASTDDAIDRLPADARIRVLHNERNLGQVPSLNRGLAEAGGKYVARLDADDTMLPSRLERQVAVLDADPSVALVGSWMDVVDERGRLYGKLRGHVRDFAELIVAILTDRYPFGHPSLTYRRNVVLELGGYDPALAPSEDKDLYRRLALARHEVRCIEEPLVHYRRHERQLSQEHRIVQLARDHQGQDRFLTELAPGTPLPSLRLLLSGSPLYWHADTPLDSGTLEGFLDAAAARLRLSGQEREQVARGLASCLAPTIMGGWTAGGSAYRSRSRPLIAFAANHGVRTTRMLLAAYPLALAASPAGRAVTAARRAGRLAAHSGSLRPARAMLRRSPLLRAVYARLLGRNDG